MYVRHGNHSFNFQGLYKVAQKLKGPNKIDDGWLKSAENLGASPFKRDLKMIPVTAKQISLDSPFKVLSSEL